MTTDRVTRESSPPLDYAAPDVPRRPRRFVVFAVLGVVVACLTLIVAGYLELFAVDSVRRVMKDAAHQRQQAEQRVARVKAADHGPPRRGLTPGEIATVLDLIAQRTNRHTSPGNRSNLVRGLPNDAQRTTLSRMLSTPGQMMVNPKVPFSDGGQVVNAGMDENGTLGFRIDYFVPVLNANYGEEGHYRAELRYDGSVKKVSRPSSPTDDVAEAQRMLAITQQGLDPRQEEIVHDGRQGAVVIGVELLLAVLLIVASASLLRNGHRAIELNYLYGIIQIPVSLMAGWYSMQLISHTPASMLHYYFAIPGVLGCFYPLVIFLGLNRSRLRNT